MQKDINGHTKDEAIAATIERIGAGPALSLNQYQNAAARTLMSEPGFELQAPEIMICWNALGLVGESGELADMIKKMFFHLHGCGPDEREKIKKELGDVLWYLSALCRDFGFILEEIAKANIKKLQQRYPDGYSSEASINRTG